MHSEIIKPTACRGKLLYTYFPKPQIKSKIFNLVVTLFLMHHSWTKDNEYHQIRRQIIFVILRITVTVENGTPEAIAISRLE